VTRPNRAKARKEIGREGKGPGRMMQWQDMLTMEMWEKMNDDRKKHS
jgi:hypothetical protein